MVYEVQKEDYEKRLAYYETGAYQYAACFIAPGAAGEQIFGKTAALEYLSGDELTWNLA